MTVSKIETLLIEEGPMISSILVKKLAGKEHISINTASQRVARHIGIKRITGFFTSNQSFIFLDQHVEDGLVYKKLSEALFLYGQKYWYTINAIGLHNGVLSQKFLESYTNYPIEPLKSHIPFSKVMQMFVKENVLVFNNNEYIFSPKFNSDAPNSFYSRAIESIKFYLLENFHTVLRNTGIISFDSGEILAEYGKFRWGFKGVCPVIGLRDQNKFGFVLADILIGKPIYENDIRFFISKIKQVQSFKRSPRLLPFLIVDNLHPDALNLLKKNGVIVGIIKELFGQKYAETMQELMAIFKNAGASLKDNPNKYLELIEELKKFNEGLLNNIRGTLFEYVVGYIHSIAGSSIEIGWEIVSSAERHEMDVRAVYNDRVIIAECKGTKSLVDKEKIEKWITKKIPAFREWFSKQDNFRYKSLEFEYWSTSGYTDDAKQYLDKYLASHKKNKISYSGPKEIRQKAVDLKNKKLKEALDNFFLRSKV